MCVLLLLMLLLLPPRGSSPSRPRATSPPQLIAKGVEDVRKKLN